MKIVVTSLVTALACITSAWATTNDVGGSQATIVPTCPHATYGADGNMGPLFCVIDNPLALSHFASVGRRTFALGPNASPGHVAAALVSDYKQGGTEPILCSVYRLAAWRNHWRFGVSPTASAGVQLHFPAGWCKEPRFSVGS
jgi:hypothetical protein